MLENLYDLVEKAVDIAIVTVGEWVIIGGSKKSGRDEIADLTALEWNGLEKHLKACCDIMIDAGQVTSDIYKDMSINKMISVLKVLNNYAYSKEYDYLFRRFLKIIKMRAANIERFANLPGYSKGDLEIMKNSGGNLIGTLRTNAKNSVSVRSSVRAVLTKTKVVDQKKHNRTIS